MIEPASRPAELDRHRDAARDARSQAKEQTEPDGTATFSRRKYTLSWPRCWYQWLSMMSRKNCARGIARISLSPCTIRQVSCMVASLHCGNKLLTALILSSYVSRISRKLDGS